MKREKVTGTNNPAYPSLADARGDRRAFLAALGKAAVGIGALGLAACDGDADGGSSDIRLGGEDVFVSDAKSEFELPADVRTGGTDTQVSEPEVVLGGVPREPDIVEPEPDVVLGGVPREPEPDVMLGGVPREPEPDVVEPPFAGGAPEPEMD